MNGPQTKAMSRAWAVEHLTQLHEAQSVFYAGGSGEALRALLTEDVVWRVPGKNPICWSSLGTWFGHCDLPAAVA